MATTLSGEREQIAKDIDRRIQSLLDAYGQHKPRLTWYEERLDGKVVRSGITVVFDG